MISSAIRNLLSNSIKFTLRGGVVELGVKMTDEDTNICVFIKDNGIGMSESTINKLFNISENISRPGTEGESSVGLGLILCKEFIEKHGGKIWVESEEGKGSTFYFTLDRYFRN